MGLFDRLLGKPHDNEWEKQLELQDWNDIVYSRKGLDMDDPVQRRDYINSCLQQMEDAARELDALELEYHNVTSHLRDIEEIDALPPEQRMEINECAQKILESEQQQENFSRRKNRMSDEEFERMERLQAEAASGAKKLAEAESYQKKIKNDLKRLDGEYQAYLFREEELENTIDNSQKLIIVIAVALVIIIVALFALQAVLELNVAYGLMLVVILTAIAVTHLYVKSTDAGKEIKSLRKSMARIVMLQNSVKIRYVNNTNLIDYLCIKYRVNNSKELNTMFDRFLQERREREKFEDAQKTLDANQKDLIYILRHYRIKDPDIWIHQPAALIDHNEEVEIRHSLNVQRQSLRKRMEYNRDIVAGNAKLEIEDMARQYPEYTQEILDMVSRYEETIPSHISSF
jgi:ABC-type multidrug transport system fused ATPase/permease subunit